MATILLETLGVARLRVGGTIVEPHAARSFGMLLFLAEERGRDVPRGELQGMIFPDQSERSSRHSVRQMLYRLRRIGAGLETSGELVRIPEDAVRADYSSITLTLPAAAASCRAIGVGILPAFEPSYSRPLSEWTEERRAAIRHSLIQQFVAQLAKIRHEGNWGELETIARAVLSIDPLNEEATLAISESLALAGQKAEAVQVLDDYIRELGPYSRDIRLPARVLRSRISEQPRIGTRRRLSEGPFVGRKAEMAELRQAYRDATEGSPNTVVIMGVPGIGKTRLAREFLASAALDGATCVSVDCASHDVTRPLGIFVDLVPQLLAAPGGLGVAPEALEHLRRLTTTQMAPHSQPSEPGPTTVYSRILDAIRDLLDAVADERPLVVLVDDAQFMDEASFRAVLTFASKASQIPLLFILASRGRPNESSLSAASDRILLLRLAALPPPACRSLYTALKGSSRDQAGSHPSETVVAMSGGNPLYIRCLASEPHESDPRRPPPTLARLLQQRIQRLSAINLRAFVATVLLGKHCRLDRLERVAGLTERELLTAIQGLETEGYLTSKGIDIRSTHPLLSEAAMAAFPPVTQRLMRSTIAELLEKEAAPGREAALLWDAAEHWHAAGATERAVSLLESCAQHCVTIGQPRRACDVLNRALALCEDTDRERVLTRLVRAARAAEEFTLLLETISQLREARLESSDATIHDDLELLALQADRYSGTPLPALVPRLRVCVFDTTAAPDHRLSAAPLLIAAYELLLDGPAAQTAYATLTRIDCPSPESILNKRLAELQYHVFAGSNDKAIRIGETLLRELRSIPAGSRLTRVAADTGMALFRCGACTSGLKAMHTAYDLARERGMAPSLLDTASMLAWMYYALGDRANMDRFDTIADSLHGAQPTTWSRSAHYLSNKIEFALASGDGTAAADWLSRANAAYSEIETPRSRLLAQAFDLRVRLLRGDAPTSATDLADLQRGHERGMRWGLHDNYVEAYWTALAEIDETQAADRMLAEYVAVHRRDGHPLLPPLAAIVGKRLG
jgi:DNA-binding SARP family transcriptional activator/Cdc6-like AAA superfamily ATPase